MAIDPRDLGEMQKALNDASGKASALWTTFVTFALYLLISFGSVTHRDLFLENPVRLPLLNVELPLTAFFAVAPAVFVIFHFYVCLQLFGLARRTVAYNTLLRSEVDTEAQRQMLRQRIDLFLVAQFLAGPRAQRVGLVGLSLRFIAWVTIVAAPVAVLLVAQLTFLPYHSAPVSWVQRLCLLIDLAVIWFFWKRIRDGDDPILPRVPPKVWEGIGIATTVLIAWFSVGVAYFPGELAERIGLDRVLFTGGDDGLHLRSLNDLLFSDDIDLATSRPLGLLNNRIVLPGQSFAHVGPTYHAGGRRSFSGRDLSYAILDRTDLGDADFSGSILRHARLIGAKLDGANFLYAKLDDADARDAQFRNVSFALASVERALFLGAKFVGARFSGSSLSAARFYRAVMIGSGFHYASLLGAQFNGAELGGTLFLSSDLRGASFVGASLVGTHFANSCLDLASFHRAHLDGIIIDRPKDERSMDEDWFVRDLQLGPNRVANYIDCATDRLVAVDFSKSDWRRSRYASNDGAYVNWSEMTWDAAPLEQTRFDALIDSIKEIGDTSRKLASIRQIQMTSTSFSYEADAVLEEHGKGAPIKGASIFANSEDSAARTLVDNICVEIPVDDARQSSMLPLATMFIGYWGTEANRRLGEEVRIRGLAAREVADLIHSHFTGEPKLMLLFIQSFLSAPMCQSLRDRLDERVLADVKQKAIRLRLQSSGP